jgi:hypothetical protein
MAGRGGAGVAGCGYLGIVGNRVGKNKQKQTGG